MKSRREFRDDMQQDAYVAWLLKRPRAVAYVFEDDAEREKQLRAALGTKRIIKRVNLDGEVVA